jgi:adenosine deaminase
MQSKVNSQFREALEQQDLALLRTVPKADLHNHSMLGLRHEEVERIYGKPLPRFRYRGNGILDLNGWIIHTYFPVFAKPGAFEAIARAAFMQARADGVTLLEMSIDAGLGFMLGIPPAKVAEILDAAHREVAPEVEYRPELGFARYLTAEKMMEWLEPFIGLGFFTAIDLYDDELSQPVRNLREVFRTAKDAGLRLKAHVGEFGTAESVREAVEVLGLDAVQHGIAAASSPEVMKWLAERGTRLNVCPTSNVVLERVPSLKAHPIRILWDHGVNVTVNTDDVLFFGQGVSEEFLNLYREGVMSAEELDRIRVSAFL